MRILLLVHAFNCLAQRLHTELTRDGHELSVELDVHERATAEAVSLFGPDVVLAHRFVCRTPQARTPLHLATLAS
jgi:putative two-component system hydrogenase maturation factor HypX/HoxX